MVPVPLWLIIVLATAAIGSLGTAMAWARSVDNRLTAIEHADREIEKLRAKSHRLSNEVTRLLTVAGIEPSDGGAE